MAGRNCQAGLGKMVQHRPWPGVAFKREVKEVSACTVVSGRGGAVLQHGNFC
jgi:hypothetical protein